MLQKIKREKSRKKPLLDKKPATLHPHCSHSWVEKQVGCCKKYVCRSCGKMWLDRNPPYNTGLGNRIIRPSQSIIVPRHPLIYRQRPKWYMGIEDQFPFRGPVVPFKGGIVTPYMGTSGGMGGGVSAAAAPSYLVSENFDGGQLCATGYSSTCTNTWTLTKNDGTDTLDFDNTSAPAPLEGTYSYRGISTGTSGSYIVKTFTAQDQVWVYYIINYDSLGTAEQYKQALLIQDSSSNTLCSQSIVSAGTWGIFNGAGFTEGSNTPSEDTTYHIWLKYKKGTGSNGECVLYVSANSTRPGSAEVSKTDTDRTAQADRIIVLSIHSNNIVVDKIRVSSSEIGSSPE